MIKINLIFLARSETQLIDAVKDIVSKKAGRRNDEFILKCHYYSSEELCAWEGEYNPNDTVECLPVTITYRYYENIELLRFGWRKIGVNWHGFTPLPKVSEFEIQQKKQELETQKQSAIEYYQSYLNRQA